MITICYHIGKLEGQAVCLLKSFGRVGGANVFQYKEQSTSQPSPTSFSILPPSFYWLIPLQPLYSASSKPRYQFVNLICWPLHFVSRFPQSEVSLLVGQLFNKSKRESSCKLIEYYAVKSVGSTMRLKSFKS